MINKNMDHKSLRIETKASLKYFVKDTSVKFVTKKIKDDEFVHYALSKIQIITQQGGKHSNGSYVEVQASLFNLSSSENTSQNKYTPQERNVFNFLLNSAFRETMSRKDEQFIEIMPITVDSDDNISGSLIFEEFGTDKTKMNFFTSELNSSLKEEEDDSAKDD